MIPHPFDGGIFEIANYTTNDLSKQQEKRAMKMEKGLDVA
jgi:hypothetical protein